MKVKPLITKINRLSLKERAYLIVSAISASICIAIVCAPRAPLRAAESESNVINESRNLQASIDASTIKLKDPTSLAYRAQHARAELASIDDELVSQNKSLQLDASIQPAIQRTLNDARGVRLISLSTHHVDAPGNQPATSASGPALRIEHDKDVLTLELEGPYLELLSYLRSIEDALPFVRWSSVELATEAPRESGGKDQVDADNAKTRRLRVSIFVLTRESK